MIDQVKALLLVALSAISGFFMPIEDYMRAILVLLLVNFLSGWIEDSIHGDGWKWKKAFKTFYECCVLLGIGAFVFVIGHFMHMREAAVQTLSCIYMAAIWFFSINIVRNWQKILPEGTTLRRFVDFLYFLAALKFVEHIPHLKEYLNIEES